MRSRTGCLTCRGRKLKCDERRPKCGQCTKASRECIPSSGIVFRHQHNASMNGSDTSDEGSLKGFYAYKNTFDRDSIWLDIPKQVTFINTTNPYLDPATPDFDTMSVSSMESTPFDTLPPTSWPTSGGLSTITSTPTSTGPEYYPSPGPGAMYRHELDHMPHLSRGCMLQTPPTSAVGTPTTPSLPLHQSFDSNLFDSCMTPPPLDPRLSSPFELACDRIPRSNSTTQPTSAYTPTVDLLLDQEHEVALLLRWFAEGPGHWMDLFDLGTYFSTYVPVKAQDNALLRFAAVAFSAKSLARMHSKRPVYVGRASHHTWMTKATQYYDTAVSLLLQAIKAESSGSPRPDSDDELPPQESEPDFVSRDSLRKRRRKSSQTSNASNTDELLAATAILCSYEFLDASVPEWARHLSGAKSLLSIAQERIMPIQLSSSPRMSPGFSVLSKARRATFWNIARQDMLAAFINKSHTRLDTEDLQLWRDAGLFIDQHGFLLPQAAVDSIYPERHDTMREDLICNALVWLMAKLINFMAAGDDASSILGPSWTGVNQGTLLEYWYSLDRQFQRWHDDLPATFKPSARMNSSFSPNAQGSPCFSEVWYSIPMCASTMQSYHMSQIQLLMNKPHESTQGRTTMFARLSSYQSILSSCQSHSREIIGISLARANDAARIHSVQPLFTAGQCLSDPTERQVVLDLLRDIESDVGWATDYRITQLREQWHNEANHQMHVT